MAVPVAKAIGARPGLALTTLAAGDGIEIRGPLPLTAVAVGDVIEMRGPLPLPATAVGDGIEMRGPLPLSATAVGDCIEMRGPLTLTNTTSEGGTGLAAAATEREERADNRWTTGAAAGTAEADTRWTMGAALTIQVRTGTEGASTNEAPIVTGSAAGRATERRWGCAAPMRTVGTGAPGKVSVDALVLPRTLR